MRRREQGQILAFFALSLTVVFGFVGLAVDGSRLFQAHMGAQVLADEAADAASQQVDIGPGSAVRGGNPPELIQGRQAGSAFDWADTYLAARATDGHTRWTIQVSPREVDVIVSRDVEMAFLKVLGIGTQTVDAEGFAAPVSGISGHGQ
ncbi:MAG: Tad domain-containing protein [Chloroflexota bacterium]|nr:Tad domain-containing protein [Chloroflexota bacterium]